MHPSFLLVDTGLSTLHVGILRLSFLPFVPVFKKIDISRINEAAKVAAYAKTLGW